MEPTTEKFVLFIDLLGFAALTENYPLDVEAFRTLDRIGSWDIDRLLGSKHNPLTNAVTTFHRTIKWAVTIAELSHSLTAITFSDCAFFATNHFHEAANVAIHLMGGLLTSGVPARAAIAHGTFATVRFRSDTSVDSGDYAAHFLGTGVVRSHEAEACGIKGLRVLIHPSASSLMKPASVLENQRKKDTIVAIKCSETECENRVGVQYELDYWRFKVSEEKRAWRALHDLWTKAGDAYTQHYLATAEAIDRMRIAQGEPPLKNLRRLTLPKRCGS